MFSLKKEEFVAALKRLKSKKAKLLSEFSVDTPQKKTDLSTITEVITEMENTIDCTEAIAKFVSMI